MKNLTVLLLLGLCALAYAAEPTPPTAPEQNSPWTPLVWENYLREGATGNNLPEFSHAGYRHGERPVPSKPAELGFWGVIQSWFKRTESPNPAIFNVRDFGAFPDDGKDDTASIQAAINAAQEKGGGVVLLSAGRYDLLMDSRSRDTVAPPRGLLISASGIVFRGAGSGPDGTSLHQHTVDHSTSLPALTSSALLRVEVPSQTIKTTEVGVSARRGDRELVVASTDSLKPGDIVRLCLVDPAVEKNNPRAEEAALASEFVAPFQITDEHNEYIRRSVNGEFNYLLEVESIPSQGRVRFKEPLRYDIDLRWNPRLEIRRMITEIGVESMRFSSAWEGGFSHHKPFPVDAQGGDYRKGGPGIIRTAAEQNYEWTAIRFSRVAHSWVKDIVTVNYTQDLDLYESKCITVDDFQIQGQNGHAGILLSRSHDCLIKNVLITAPRVHAFYVAFFAAGNVFTESRFDYGPFDKASDCDTCLDLHGAAPNENLFEKITNAYVYPGGAYGYLPHAGKRNVFWNIEAPERMERYEPGNEFFRTYAKTSSGAPDSAHEHWPQAFVIGVHRKGSAPATIGGSTTDRADEWITIEGLNRPGVEPASLYEGQRHRAATPNGSQE